jgi:lysyl-tRNA synthetase class II
MNVVDLVRDADLYIGKEVTVTGRLDRPRKKHSNYLFFNIDNQAGIGIQAVIKKDLLGEARFKELIYGLKHGAMITAIGKFDLRNSTRADFYKYELTVTNIIGD